MMSPPLLKSAALAALPHIRHAFFTRQGGVSTGIFASLNAGLGSADDKAAVAENRARCTAALGLPPDGLVTLYQIHSATAIRLDNAPPVDARPQADGMATARSGIGLGVLAADCAPILLADSKRPVIGAAHAGWKGALGGIIEATVTLMEAQGARRAALVAAVGPCISGTAYEVGPEFEARFLSEDPASAACFSPGAGDRRQFNLPGYVALRLKRAGVGTIDGLGLCTYGEPERFFSFRRATHRGEPDYGRNLSGLCLA